MFYSCAHAQYVVIAQPQSNFPKPQNHMAMSTAYREA